MAAMGKKKQRRAIPRFKHPVFETHCHLDYLEGEALESTLRDAADVGVERIITIAVSPGNLDTVYAISERFDQVWCSQFKLMLRKEMDKAWQQAVDQYRKGKGKDAGRGSEGQRP